MRLTHSSLAQVLVAAGSAVIVLFLLTIAGHLSSNEPGDRVPPPTQRQAAESPIVDEPIPCSELPAHDADSRGDFRGPWLTRC